MSERRIVDFIIVATDRSLENAVKYQIDMGWEPFGPPTFADDGAMQPMVRYAEPEPGGAFVSRAEFVNLQSWQKMKWIKHDGSNTRPVPANTMIGVIMTDGKTWIVRAGGLFLDKKNRPEFSHWMGVEQYIVLPEPEDTSWAD
jgi:hypothetical protein